MIRRGTIPVWTGIWEIKTGKLQNAKGWAYQYVDLGNYVMQFIQLNTDYGSFSAEKGAGGTPVSHGSSPARF
jgi:hypothetical protein